MKPQLQSSTSLRLSIWQATHKQLLHDDLQYRRRFRYYLATMICLSCFLLPFYLPFFGIRLFGPAADISIILGVAVVIVCLTLRQFHFQARHIRQYLLRTTAPREHLLVG